MHTHLKRIAQIWALLLVLSVALPSHAAKRSLGTLIDDVDVTTSSSVVYMEGYESAVLSFNSSGGTTTWSVTTYANKDEVTADEGVVAFELLTDDMNYTFPYVFAFKVTATISAGTPGAQCFGSLYNKP